jgi:hypothetical protein
VSQPHKPDNKPEGLAIEYTPAGRNGSATVTARLAGEILACERFTLAKSKARRDFARTVADGRPGIDAGTIEAELLKAAADLASKPEADAPADWAALPEIDASRIIRPERAITPEVSAVAIPSMAALGDRVAGRWRLYLRWSDGTRERRALGPTLDLPGGGRLWIHPEPSEPTPNMRPGWSAESRKRWLAGEPAPDPADVFKRICERIAFFLDLPRHQVPGVTATLACWVILTYAYSAWPAVPYLYLGGPLGSGKSRVFEILARLVFRPLASSNMTAASLFRTLHANGGCLLLDEAERLRNTRDPDVAEISSMLLAGYKRGGSAIRLEPVGDSGFRTVTFDVFGPKALACISGLPPALASRAIPITMFRAAPGSPKPRRRIDADPGGWQRLRDDLHALALENGRAFLGLADRADVCPEMTGRDFELWQPLLALASWLEEAGALGLLKLLQEHALTTIDSGRDDQTPDHDETLLRLLAEAVRFGERPTPGDLLDRAKEGEAEAFKRWTPRAVAEHLKRYTLATIKTDGRKRYARVTLDDLGRIQTNYGIDLGL